MAEHAIMNKKKKLIHCIEKLNDEHKLDQLLKDVESDFDKKIKERGFGSGKHIFTYVADDFNEPLEDLKDYM